MIVNWKKDSFVNEEEEFQLVATELTKSSDHKEWTRNFEKLKSAYRNGKFMKLSDAFWRRLENTDSFKVKTMKDIEKFITTNSGDSGARDIYEVIKEIVSGVCRAPIVMKKDSKYTLVAGNARLMAARLLGIRPDVIVMAI
jgi:hypothetical protein